MEYAIGFEYVREPEFLLPEGSVVETHTHNHHHNTHLTMGLWDVFRYQPVVDDDENVTGWLALPTLRVQGGGPRSIVPIPKNMKHKFVLVKGWGYYRCVFAHRDEAGNYCEEPQGYGDAYV